MAVCLDYQTVYLRKQPVSLVWHINVAASVVILGAIVTRIWLRNEATELGYQIAREQQLLVDVTKERQDLELHKVVLHRPDALAERAEKELGLKPLQKGRVFKIS
jgi:cell division protein FtsL